MQMTTSSWRKFPVTRYTLNPFFRRYDRPLFQRQRVGNFNWKTMMDGYQECYHCRSVSFLGIRLHRNNHSALSIAHPGFDKVRIKMLSMIVFLPLLLHFSRLIWRSTMLNRHRISHGILLPRLQTLKSSKDSRLYSRRECHASLSLFPCQNDLTETAWRWLTNYGTSWRLYPLALLRYN